MSTQEMMLLAKLLDEIIPKNDPKNIPAGGSLDVCNYLVIALKKSGNDWAVLMDKIHNFGASENNSVAFLCALEASEPALFQRLKRFTYMGYYGRAEIRPYFGPSSEPTQPRGYEVPHESPELLANLTAKVVSRGVCFRAVPKESRPNEK